MAGAEGYICLGGVEVANHARLVTYVGTDCPQGVWLDPECVCALLSEVTFTDPASDPAPWYEATEPASEEYLGLWATTLEWEPVLRRGVSELRLGSAVSAQSIVGRVVSVNGYMFASSARGMAYGEAWLREVLLDPACGACGGRDAVLLPACDPDAGDEAFRTLVSTFATDGPTFIPLDPDDDDPTVQRFNFTLVSRKPWFARLPDRCLDGVSIGAGQNCLLTTPTWQGHGTFVIEVENTDTVPVTDITIVGQISLDESCPTTGDAAFVPPSFTYVVPELLPGDRIVIDGLRREARYYDASCKAETSAFPFMEFEGLWKWPDVGPCTSMCLSVDAGGGDALLTVDTVGKEY